MPQDDIDEFLSRYKGGSEIDNLYGEFTGQQQPAPAPVRDGADTYLCEW